MRAAPRDDALLVVNRQEIVDRPAAAAATTAKEDCGCSRAESVTPPMVLEARNGRSIEQLDRAYSNHTHFRSSGMCPPSATPYGAGYYLRALARHAKTAGEGGNTSEHHHPGHHGGALHVELY